MPRYLGFSTIGKRKKFSLTDRDLVKQDLQNAFGIREGEVPGRPEVGTKIWSYVHNPNDEQSRLDIEQEVRRIIDMDSRLELHEVFTEWLDNTVQVSISVSILPEEDIEEFFIRFQTEAGVVDVS